MEEQTLFPSQDWFQQLAARMRAQEHEYRRLGPMDCTMIVRVSSPGRVDQNFEVVFEALSVRSIREVEEFANISHQHFVIEASLSTWREMIENIRAHQGPDLQHTLNYLTFPGDPMQVNGPAQLEPATFDRYHRSIQTVSNGATEIPTAYG